MIKDILNILQISDFYGESKRIDIAKGMYSIPYSFDGAWKQIKRIIKSKR